jgi:hypothetical protein
MDKINHLQLAADRVMKKPDKHLISDWSKESRKILNVG